VGVQNNKGSRRAAGTVGIALVVLLGAASGSPAHAFNLDTARTMLTLSGAVMQAPDQAVATTNRLGGADTRFFDGGAYAARQPGFFDPASQVMITRMVQNGKTVYVVAFRGTEVGDPRDLQTDLNTRLAPMSPQLRDVKIHSGFLKTANLGVEAVRPLLDQLRNDPNAEIVFTGHSLGGSGAIVAAAQLADAGVPRNKITAYTFGAPAVGNRAFAERYGDLRVYRVDRPTDPIPKLLDNSIMGFRHIGKQALLENGNLEFREPRRRGLIGRFIDGLRTVLSFFGLGRNGRDSFLDHQRGGYEGLMANARAAGGLTPAEVAQSTQLVTQPVGAVPAIAGGLPGAPRVNV
jgi:hypothetical protein